MQYQYPPNLQNQPQYPQYPPNHYPQYQQQYHPQYNTVSYPREPSYDHALYKNIQPQHSHLINHQIQPRNINEPSYNQTIYNNIKPQNYPPSQLQSHNVNESRYWQIPHNMPAVVQRQISKSQLNLAPSISSAKINTPLIHDVVYEQQPLNPPQSIRQIQYIPYQKRYVDYVAQRIQVPVERYLTDYYEIEHVVDFVPRQYQDTVVQMVPEEVIKYRLEYVPVQKKIVHMNKQDVINFQKNAIYGQKIQPLPISNFAAQQNKVADINSAIHKQISNLIPAQSSQSRINEKDINSAIYKQLNNMIPGQSPQNRTHMDGSRVSNRSNLSRRSRKTNYVTVDNYNPSYRDEELYQQSRVINNMNNIDDRFMKRQTEKQYRNTRMSQSSGSRVYR